VAVLQTGSVAEVSGQARQTIGGPCHCAQKSIQKPSASNEIEGINDNIYAGIKIKDLLNLMCWKTTPLSMHCILVRTIRKSVSHETAVPQVQESGEQAATAFSLYVDCRKAIRTQDCSH
jgi:hypothetical protein